MIIEKIISINERFIKQAERKERFLDHVFEKTAEYDFIFRDDKNKDMENEYQLFQDIFLNEEKSEEISITDIIEHVAFCQGITINRLRKRINDEWQDTITSVKIIEFYIEERKLNIPNAILQFKKEFTRYSTCFNCLAWCIISSFWKYGEQVREFIKES